jgi:bifunctional DNase/RNase
LDKVQLEILGLSSSPSAGGAYALLLKEMYGIRRIPIIIGAYEAQSIALELEGIKPPRPLTHDLLANIIKNLHAVVNEIVITELRENTFFAKIVFEISGMTNDVDSRPSDAIALAVRLGVPIFITEKVMDIASFVPSSEEQKDMKEEYDDSLEDDMDDNKPEEQSSNPSDMKIASLQDQLRDAIEKEDYERAAKLRDEINKAGDRSLN